jgi:hypothetical protein
MTTEPNRNKPTHYAYVVKPKPGTEQIEWVEVGAAWEHSDQQGLTLSMPVLGEKVVLTIRRKKPKD